MGLDFAERFRQPYAFLCRYIGTSASDGVGEFLVGAVSGEGFGEAVA